MKNTFLDMFTYLLLALFAVLVVTHASNFATAVSSISSFVTSESKILTGAGSTSGG
jgi:hypothetical protein